MQIILAAKTTSARLTNSKRALVVSLLTHEVIWVVKVFVTHRVAGHIG